MEHTTVKDVVRVFWKHTLVYKWTALLLLIALILRTSFDLIGPLFFKRFFDTLAVGDVGLVAELIEILVMILGVGLLAWFAARIRDVVSIRLQTRVMADLSNTAFGYLIHHSYRFFTNMFGGSLVRRVNRLSRAYETVINELEYQLVPLVVSVLFIVTVIFTRSALLGWILLGWIVFVLVLSFFIARWKQKYEEARARIDSEATGVLADSITNSVTTKLFSGFTHEQSLYARVVERLRKMRAFTWALNEGIDAIQGFLMIGIEFGMLYVAVQLWRDGLVTIGDFALIQAYLLTLFHRVWMFGRVIRNLYQAFADAQEMVDILEMPHEVKDHPRAEKLVVPEGEIVFDDVTFAFHQTREVLKDFTLCVAPGEKIALVGPSGAGKSTVTQLLLRFHDVDSGNITIDGQNIARVTQNSLRDAVAYVPQEPILFHRSLMDNIRYGRREATDEEVIEAARQAHCHEFISRLYQGYNTYVGERGVKLSGGERQRVAIARAILKDAPILVLDEATSSLDSESEQYIQEALRELMQGRTTMVIAHRLSTIMQMDRIVVIDDGSVVDTGTHEELLEGDGIYKKLWEIQAGGFIE